MQSLNEVDMIAINLLYKYAYTHNLLIAKQIY